MIQIDMRTALDLHSQFLKSEDAATLRAACRYERFKPEGISKEQWVRLLGADVCNLEHLKISLHLTRLFISINHNPRTSWRGREVSPQACFDSDEALKLTLTAVVHDWAEARKGDISFDLKTDADERQELQILRGMLAPFQSALPILAEVPAILSDGESKIGRAFNAIERAGYLRTALVAVERSTFSGLSRECCFELGTNCLWLASNVLGNQLEKLMQYAPEYPSIYELLISNRQRIEGVFDSVLKAEDPFASYKSEEREAQRIKFHRAHTVWRDCEFA